MTRAARPLNTEITWFDQRRCYRFKYRDPFTGERKFINANAGQFEAAGIPLPDPEIVRKPTKTALTLAKQLQISFYASLQAVRPESFAASAPMISGAIEQYFALYDHQTPGYRKTLRAIFEEFLRVVGDKPIDEVRDIDLKTYERHIAQRCNRTTVRSYLAQFGMLLHFGVKKGWIRLDPRLTYKPPREELKAPNPFSKEELARFFEVVREPVRWHPKGRGYLEWIGVGLLTLGLRPVELRFAEWEDVNWEKRFLYIRRSHANKMPQACQNQPIPLAAWPYFEARRGATGRIWTGHYGGECSPTVMQRALKGLQKDLPGFQWKRLRKTYATILEEAGNDVLVVSRLLRHSAGGKNVTIAQRHYIGRSQEHLRELVDEAFAKERSPWAGGHDVHRH